MTTAVLSPTRRRVARISSSLALVVLVAGSAITVGVLWSFGRTSVNDLDALAVVVYWPASLMVAGLLGGLALLVQRRRVWTVAALWGVCILLMIPPPCVALAGADWMDTHGWHSPFDALVLSLIVALLAALNCAALYAAWRFVLRVRPRNKETARA